VHELHVVVPNVRIEPREHAVSARVVSDVLKRLEAGGEDALTERGVGEDLDAELFARVDDAAAL
jgi:hypothetical protein